MYTHRATCLPLFDFIFQVKTHNRIQSSEDGYFQCIWMRACERKWQWSAEERHQRKHGGKKKCLSTLLLFIFSIHDYLNDSHPCKTTESRLFNWNVWSIAGRRRYRTIVWISPWRRLKCGHTTHECVRLSMNINSFVFSVTLFDFSFLFYGLWYVTNKNWVRRLNEVSCFRTN